MNHLINLCYFMIHFYIAVIDLKQRFTISITSCVMTATARKQDPCLLKLCLNVSTKHLKFFRRRFTVSWQEETLFFIFTYTSSWEHRSPGVLHVFGFSPMYPRSASTRSSSSRYNFKPVLKILMSG